MTKKNPYGAVDVPEPTKWQTQAEAASAAAAKRDKAEDAKIFTADKKLPVDLTEKTKDTKPTGYAHGGGISAKKFRKFDEGGLTEGPNKNIDDDTRARAMEAVRRRMAGEDTEEATPAPAPRARPKAVVITAKTTPKENAPAPKKSAESDASVPSTGRYKQDTYETPLKSAFKKYAPEVAENLGKVAAGMGAGYGVSKLLGAVDKADKVRKEAQLVSGNAKLADRMRGIVSGAEKKVAEAPALKKANESLATRMEVAKSTAKGKADRARRSQQDNTASKDDQGFYRAGGSVGSASRRADGCATKGKTKGRVV